MRPADDRRGGPHGGPRLPLRDPPPRGLRPAALRLRGGAPQSRRVRTRPEEEEEGPPVAPTPHLDSVFVWVNRSKDTGCLEVISADALFNHHRNLFLNVNRCQPQKPLLLLGMLGMTLCRQTGV